MFLNVRATHNCSSSSLQIRQKVNLSNFKDTIYMKKLCISQMVSQYRIKISPLRARVHHVKDRVRIFTFGLLFLRKCNRSPFSIYSTIKQVGSFMVTQPIMLTICLCCPTSFISFISARNSSSCCCPEVAGTKII